MITYNRIVNILLIVFVVAAVFFYLEDTNSKANIKRLQTLLEDSRVEYQELEKRADSILKIRNKAIIEYITIEKKLKPIKDEKASVDSVVYSYNERKLDSTIRTYKHPKGN